MQDKGIAVQKFKVCTSPDEAEQQARELDVDEIVIKAQVFAGGRGKVATPAAAPYPPCPSPPPPRLPRTSSC